jgi:PAS domain S-box-containing protein
VLPHPLPAIVAAPDPGPVAAMAHLRAQDSRLQSLLGSARDAVVAMDQDGLVTDWNPAAERLLGWTRDEALGQRLSTLIVPPQQRLAHETGLARYLRTREAHVMNRLVEVDALRRDGVLLKVELSIWSFEVDGMPNFGAFIRDISERQGVKDALRLSEERYRTVVEHLGEGLVVIQDNRVVFANPRAGEILQVPVAELVGTSYLDRIHPEDRAISAARQAARLQGALDIPELQEMRYLRSDGQTRWIEVHVTVTPWDGAPASMAFFSDVTERRTVIDALHRSEQRYRAVIEHVGDGMVVVQDSRFVFVNTHATEIVELPHAEMIGSGYLSRIHPGDHALLQDRQRRRLAGEDVPDRYEIRLVMPDGRIKWVDIGVTIVPWDGGDATLTFFSDVTPRKALEEQLQRTLEERETILASSIVGIAFLTPEGRFRWANQAMAQIFGVTTDTHNLISVESLYLSREQYLQVGAEVADCIRQGKAYQTELQMQRLDGSRLWVSLSGKAVSLRDLTQGTVWVMMDITRRKELEDSLQRTSSEREAILNTALVGIVFSAGSRLLWANDKFIDMLGYPRSDWESNTVQLVNVMDPSWEQHKAHARAELEATGTYAEERQLRHRSGALFWVQLAGRCVRERDPESGVIWTFLDITRRKKAEVETREALERQKELNDLRSRFVAMTSHEFRTPLAAILSSAELLKHYGDRLPADEKLEVLSAIEDGVQRMTGLLDRVLLLGKADARMLEFRPQRQDLLPLCRQLVDEAGPLLAASACGLEVRLPDGPGPLQARVDDKLLRHIFGNLLANAIKYSPGGGQVRFVLQADAQRLLFEVSDQGIGIPTEEIPHLFESFHRASNVGHIPGTGLGLAIVKNAVQLHGGGIEVHSSAGEGACFRVWIPRGED